MGILTNAPKGFPQAVAMLNALPQSLLAEMSQDVMAFLQYNTGFINTESHCISVARVATDGQTIKAEMCINALTFMFRSAAVESLSLEDFVGELKASLLFQDSSLAVLKAIWKSDGPSLCSLPKQSLSVGELYGMDWALGVALSSSSCRALNSPHLTLQLRVAETGEDMKIKNIEMSLPEFQNFASQLKEISNALDTA